MSTYSSRLVILLYPVYEKIKLPSFLEGINQMKAEVTHVYSFCVQGIQYSATNM